jgi:hypothetical protein
LHINRYTNPAKITPVIISKTINNYPYKLQTLQVWYNDYVGCGIFSHIFFI